jgi:acyl-CoA thioesterase
MDIEVTLAVEGHQVTQARATGRVGEAEILTVNAALGIRPIEAAGEWAVRPDVPGPEACPERVRSEAPGESDTVMARVEQRLAAGRQPVEIEGGPGDGRCALWARMPELLEASAAGLAVLGDHVPFGIRQATGRPGGGRSLDNTLRVVRLVPTEWVLLDIRVHAIAGGFGHGLIHLWAEDGPLLATASQSAIVRVD